EYGPRSGYSRQSTPGGGGSTNENYALDDDEEDNDEEEKLDRVLASYGDARKANPEEIAIRTVGSLKRRWLRIAPAVVKWCGGIDKARIRSWQNADDVIAKAHKIHRTHMGSSSSIKSGSNLRCGIDIALF
uniref:Uncharacterized protein n=1 Tax=Chenopodium quinoa TaxID=63459 RepID=A0A803N7M9_CHEQI